MKSDEAPLSALAWKMLPKLVREGERPRRRLHRDEVHAPIHASVCIAAYGFLMLERLRG